MKFETVHSIVGHVPFISKENAAFLYELVMKERLTSILELGVAHGTATCYMAAALEEIGGGSITSVDLIEAKALFTPSPEEQLAKTGLERFVQIVRMQTGYTWFLHDAIASNTRNDRCQPVYDLCVIDGPKNWTIDGAAFFFVDKLLENDGWIIFDDYDWTYAEADSRRDQTDGITHRALSKEERETPQIREVFELLVKQHPDYSRFFLRHQGGWAGAQKHAASERTYTTVYEESYRGLLAMVMRKARRTLSRIVR